MKGEIQGLPAFVRVDAGLKKDAQRADFGYEILVTIAFNSAGENGLPSSDEDLCAVDDIEDRCKNHQEKDAKSVLALVITTGGFRQLHFYSSDPDHAIRQWEDTLQPRIETHQVDFVVHPDSGWKAYMQFA